MRFQPASVVRYTLWSIPWLNNHAPFLVWVILFLPAFNFRHVTYVHPCAAVSLDQTAENLVSSITTTNSSSHTSYWMNIHVLTPHWKRHLPLGYLSLPKDIRTIALHTSLCQSMSFALPGLLMQNSNASTMTCSAQSVGQHLRILSGTA